MKCGGTFSKGCLAVRPAKDTNCTSCKYKGHFTKLCKSRRKNVNIVNTQILDNTVALIDQKGVLNHLKLTNNFKSNGSTVHKPHSHFTVKREPTLNIQRSNTCMKCGGTFSKGCLAVRPAKDTNCTSCKYKGHFTKLCKSRRKNVNIVNTQILDNTGFNPSDHPDVNIDHLNRESCGVINAWSESGQKDKTTITLY